MSLYFRASARSTKNKMPRYDDDASTFESVCDLEIFQYSGRCISPRGTHELSREEYKVAFLYILTNIPDMDDFFEYELQITITHLFQLSYDMCA